MKLYSELSAIYSKTVTKKDILTILRNLGIENEFQWVIGNKYFVNFIYYFVNMYSVDSTMMDTTSFHESEKIIAKAFDFDFVTFKKEYIRPNEDLEPQQAKFEADYFDLITTYLKIQRNRDHEALMTGLILYRQMISACTSMAIITKGKDEIENVNYSEKHKIFMNAIELNEELKKLEVGLSKALAINEVVEENKEKLNIRIEENIPRK